jgi:hypothetical protein
VTEPTTPIVDPAGSETRDGTPGSVPIHQWIDHVSTRILFGCVDRRDSGFLDGSAKKTLYEGFMKEAETNDGMGRPSIAGERGKGAGEGRGPSMDDSLVTKEYVAGEFS